MNRMTSILATSMVCMLPLSMTHAAEACFASIDGIQITPEGGSNLALYIYSSEILALSGNGSTYLYYSGVNDVVKSFHAQFLFARATEVKVCVAYTPGTPSYRWVLSSVAVVNADGSPFE